MSIDISAIRPKQDNILVLMDIHDAPQEELETPGGILIPRSAQMDAKSMGAVYATVYAAGPGHHADRWGGQELGIDPYDDGPWIPMNPELTKGTRVILDSAKTGQRIWSDERREFRMVREMNCIAIVEEG